MYHYKFHVSIDCKVFVGALKAYDFLWLDKYYWSMDGEECHVIIDGHYPSEVDELLTKYLGNTWLKTYQSYYIIEHFLFTLSIFCL